MGSQPIPQPDLRSVQAYETVPQMGPHFARSPPAAFNTSRVHIQPGFTLFTRTPENGLPRPSRLSGRARSATHHGEETLFSTKRPNTLRRPVDMRTPTAPSRNVALSIRTEVVSRVRFF